MVKVVRLDPDEKRAFKKIVDAIDAGSDVSVRFVVQELNISRKMVDRLEEAGVIFTTPFTSPEGIIIEELTLTDGVAVAGVIM